MRHRWVQTVPRIDPEQDQDVVFSHVVFRNATNNYHLGMVYRHCLLAEIINRRWFMVHSGWSTNGDRKKKPQCLVATGLSSAQWLGCSPAGLARPSAAT